ncbi:MAG TPA: cupredoxin family copper-binding protein [Chloroflexia bacterium]|jgi:plastocyanin
MKGTIKRLLPVGMALVLALPAFGSGPGYAQGTSRTFTETGKTVKGRFLEYWNANGGLAQQGLPISEEMQEKSDTDGKTYMVQYFERAVFESHPDNPKPNDVLLSLLGNFLYQQKYPNGAPNQKVSTTNARKFAETGKTVGGKFRAYWEKNGGLPQQGYPISEEFQEKSDLDGKTYTVQYFERAVFELHTENAPPYDVLLSQLGTFRYRAKYGAATTTGPKEVNVNIVNFKFDPGTLTVDVGTKVTWTQLDETIHDSTSKTKVWSSPILNKGDKYSYTFTKAGTYEYWCSIHPEMLGRVVVK